MRIIPISVAGLTALAWTLTGVATALTAGRFAIRMKRLNGLQVDDGLHAFALITLVVYAALFTATLPMMDALQSWVEEQGPEPSASTLKRYHLFTVVASILFWVCVYSVKFAFLAFYRHLFGVSRSFLKAWWAVFAFTLVTFSYCTVSNFFACGNGPDALMTCLSGPTAPRTMMKAQCVLNIISDLAIMGLPICMLKRLKQIPRAQKLGLASLFSMATVVIIVDILRLIYSLGIGVLALDSIWDILEPSISVMISALPIYRALFTTGKKRDTRSSMNFVHTSHNKNSYRPVHELISISVPATAHTTNITPTHPPPPYRPVTEPTLPG